ncbi:hypothetical protein CcaverHIS002_0501900 [Cutaneotrichosporon cavernicola]|uniref:Thiolase n=1 Tax=Cutaneotrichosporon cavernicola TaxID=279322 RepID=A0AA48L634_9TREE|nr:uncharacterized protein CcaverHIS019_0502490 [Cutaneotrichosporon cavernicola]BEI84789.1 hypothetical protein CcaverHIS002_0501900 [Cutaneotrichosporon cavernicola]BEI92621.1 hypothetical protein CcaverHIS019_0502490 [Cutaneotrichosporon cavernicola]BEJ00396.1 hypothetical protein CcaverHIS631_0502530 [Cutaneotrichosporon cavernicola]BEJ08166.1 hypothetical protein CcaverHIS641_0502510 [Cutaneotrichosporon cavernicola]
MSGKASLLSKNPDDVVILAAKRTPMCRATKGALKDARFEDMLVGALKGAVSAARIDPKLVEDIQIGTVRTPRGGASISRMAALAAGFPIETSVSTVNRQCSSSLQAIWTITNEIRAGDIDIGIAGGCESMTHHYARTPLDHPTSEAVRKHPLAADCLIPMGITNENVVEDYALSRQEQDEFAARSHQKAEAAQKAGRFDGEIVPVTIGDKTVTRDDTPRYGVTAESLKGLKPAFKADGTTHAGNSSQLTDGAAAVVLARRSVAENLGLPIIGKVGCVVTAGVPPRIMGVGPAVAIPKALRKVGLQLSDVDIFEINEAFAGQALYCAKDLGLDQSKLNPNGGAIAIGHPLGATGARQVATGLNEAKRTGAKVVVTSMCAGTGFGVAGVFVNEQGSAKL